MNKIGFFQGLAVVVAVGLTVTAGYFTFKESNDLVVGSSTASSTSVVSAVQRDILSYVPADTIYFFGGLESAPFQKTLEVFVPGWSWLQKADMSTLIDQEKTKNMPPAGKMILSLYVEYMKALNKPSEVMSRLGLGENVDAAIYSVGVLPVMRVKLADIKAFNALLERAEKAVQIEPEVHTYSGTKYRLYGFEKAGANKVPLELIIGEKDQYVVFALTASSLNETVRDRVLGLTKPEKSLADITLLADIKAKYDYHPAYLGYLNHREIMQGLTATDGNEFGRMLDHFIQIATSNKNDQPPPQSQRDLQTITSTDRSSNQHPLSTIQTAECRSELMTMTETWPRSVFGYTQMDLGKPVKMTAHALIESTDGSLMNDLQKLRGFIPGHLFDINHRSLFGLGLGINIDELTPVVTRLMKSLTENNYQCQWLADMKQGLMKLNPVFALSMVSGMAAGVQGISFSVIDFDGKIDISQKKLPADMRNLDAIVTLSATNPQALLMMASGMLPGIPALPSDGTAVDLPLPFAMPNGESVKLAMKGNHLTAYIGKQAEQIANSLANVTLSATGLSVINMNFGKYFDLFYDAILSGEEAASIPQESKQMFEEMRNMDAQMIESFDITPQGLAVEMKMVNH